MPIARIATALLTGQAIRLHSICHDLYWTATFAERNQLREALSTLDVESDTDQLAEKFRAAS